jgi:hypothetical protein
MNYFQAMTDFIIYGVRDIGKVNVLRLIADIDVVMERILSSAICYRTPTYVVSHCAS